MKPTFLATSFLCAGASHGLSAETPEPTAITLFDRGTNGYHTYRIPALVTAANGDLLAFGEGRVNGIKDNGNVDIVLRRSSDGGVTWAPQEVVGDLGARTVREPQPDRC